MEREITPDRMEMLGNLGDYDKIRGPRGVDCPCSCGGCSCDGGFRFNRYGGNFYPN